MPQVSVENGIVIKGVFPTFEQSDLRPDLDAEAKVLPLRAPLPPEILPDNVRPLGCDPTEADLRPEHHLLGDYVSLNVTPEYANRINANTEPDILVAEYTSSINHYGSSVDLYGKNSAAALAATGQIERFSKSLAGIVSVSLVEAFIDDDCTSSRDMAGSLLIPLIERIVPRGYASYHETVAALTALEQQSSLLTTLLTSDTPDALTKDIQRRLDTYLSKLRERSPEQARRALHIGNAIWNLIGPEIERDRSENNDDRRRARSVLRVV